MRNFWHMQMHQGVLHSGIEEKILKEKKMIGMGHWEEDIDQQSNFEKVMQEGDIVAIKSGGQIIALVEVTGPYKYADEVGDLDWFNRRRKVKILDWYKPEYNFYIAPRGTLTRCNSNGDAASTKSILKWYNQIQTGKMKSEAIELLKYKKQIILQGPPGTGKTFLAKDLAEEILFGKVSENKQEQTSKLEKSGKFKLVQFHPSYTYDDFVRGIQADPESGTFTAVNKVFGEYCERALKNYVQSKPDLARSLEIDRQEWVDEKINEFADFITDQLAADIEHPLTEKAKIVEVNERGFRYQGNWSNSSIVPFKDLKTMYLANNVLRQDVKFQDGLNRSAFYHATYYFYLLEKFREFLNQNNFVFEERDRVEKDPETYILIIDEINRANLPSVLGELIYALEYRDKPIESMYSLSNSGNSLIIPSNLLIIGTMNTADRSVGHIDYAIRRRFAFVDILPTIDPIKNKLAKDMFQKVSSLFVSNHTEVISSQATPKRADTLMADFRPEEVWIGHSYFLTSRDSEEGDNEIKTKMKYEVLPLLKEYVKDGILRSNEDKLDDPVQMVLKELSGL